jgi:hypothetical protein
MTRRRVMYAWLITRDDVDGGKDKGLIGPRGCPLTSEEIAAAGLAFRMLDDDGEVYYHGLYKGPSDESLFGPLDDFGMPNAGCTSIEYRNAAGEWEKV